MMYVCQIIMLCTLNLDSALCQLYLNKTGRKKNLRHTPKDWKKWANSKQDKSKEIQTKIHRSQISEN